MARPTDWWPLAESDPVPGDPQRISEQAAHLAGTAQEIAGQVARLRAIAAGQSAEQGLHAEKLKSASSDVARGLEKVVGRYQKTSAALSGWVPELEYAQSQSLKALAQAQDAAARQRASQPVTRQAGYQETPQDRQDDQTRATALSQASSDLAAARQMLSSATSYRDQALPRPEWRRVRAWNDDGRFRPFGLLKTRHPGSMATVALADGGRIARPGPGSEGNPAGRAAGSGPLRSS